MNMNWPENALQLLSYDASTLTSTVDILLYRVRRDQQDVAAVEGEKTKRKYKGLEDGKRARIHLASPKSYKLEMEGAEDKFFNDYLRRNMAMIVTKVKVREIVPHLPSLTLSDRENIEAKRENTGNYNAMQLLLSCLRRKDNWLEEFVIGLQKCDHSALASQIKEEFKSLIQSDGSTPMAPTPGGTLQPPHNPSTISTPIMDKAKELFTPFPSGNGMLANHTGSSSAVIQSQSRLEPVVSLQNHTTKDIGAVPSTILVTPTHIASPQVPLPGPLMMPIHDSNPPDKKCHSAANYAAVISKSTVGQVLTQDLLLSESLVSPTKEVAGVSASLNVQDGLISPFCVGGASIGEKVCTSKPVLQISIHSVQVHQPFDSPSTFPPVQVEGTHSGNSVNLECSSSFLHHTSKIVSTECRALSNAENSDLNHKEKRAPGEAKSIVLSGAENVAPSDTPKVTTGDEHQVALSDMGGVALSDTETVAIGDAESVAQGLAESETFSDAARVAPGSIESDALCDAGTVVPCDMKSETLQGAESSVKEVVTLHAAEDVFSGDISAGENVKGVQPADKNTVVPNDEDGIVCDKIESIVSDNRENLVSDYYEKFTMNVKSFVGDKETIVCGSESRGETDYCDSAHDDRTQSRQNQGSVIHNSVGPNKMQNRAADNMDSTAPCSMENTALTDLDIKDPSCTYPVQNVWKENDCGIAHQDISSPEAPTSNYNSGGFFPGQADNGVLGENYSEDSGRKDSVVLCEGDRSHVNLEIGTLGDTDSGTLCNIDSGAPAKGHSGASTEDSGDTDEAPDGRDSGTSVGKDGGVPEEGDSELLGDTDSWAPGNGDYGVSGEGDSGAHRGRDNGAPEDGGTKAAGEVDSGRPQEEDNRESADRDSAVPGKGDSIILGKGQSGGPEESGSVILEEGESWKPEVRNTGAPGEEESEGPAEGDCDTTGGIDSRALDEVPILLRSYTELPPKNSEEIHNFNHLAVNYHASNHIPENIVPCEIDSAIPNLVQSTSPGHIENVVHRDVEATHKELMDNQCNSTHTEINLPVSALTKPIPETVGPKGIDQVTPGNTEPLNLETEENHCSAVHHKISLSLAESFIPSTDSASSNIIGTQSPGDTTSPEEPAQNHSSSTPLNINLTSASLSQKPDSVSNIDMKSHTHKPTKNQSSTPCLDITDGQDEDKKELRMSEDFDVQNPTTSGETPVGIRKDKKLEAFPEQCQPTNHSPLGSYYVPTAVIGMVAAAMLWQLKK